MYFICTNASSDILMIFFWKTITKKILKDIMKNQFGKVDNES